MQPSSIIIIHGGNSYSSEREYQDAIISKQVSYLTEPKRGWKDEMFTQFSPYLPVLMPKMPSKDNAKLDHWLITFQKLIPFIDERTMFVGHSLGGVFLAIYLSTYWNLPFKAGQVHLVAPDYNEGEFVFDITKKDNLLENSNQIHLWQSEDDFALELTGGRKYRELIPKSNQHIFEDKGHFLSEHFYELYRFINNSLKL